MAALMNSSPPCMVRNTGLRARSISPEFLDGLKAVQPGHRHVDHRDIGLETQGQIHRLTPVGRRRDDVEIGGQEAGDRFQHLKMVVGQEYARPGGSWDGQREHVGRVRNATE